MKKLLYLLLTVLIVSCSSDDLNPVPACWENPSFEGTWESVQTVGEGDDAITTTYTYELNSGGTGTLATVAGPDSETFNDITWSDARSEVSVYTGTLTISNGTTLYYVWIGCNQFTAHSLLGAPDDTYNKE